MVPARLLHSLPLGAAMLVLAAAPALARPFAVAADRHTPNEVTFTSKAPLVRMVGRTSQVSGIADINLDDLNKSTGRFEVPLGTLETGIQMRDGHMRDVLATDQFPTAQFVIKKVSARTPKATAGDAVDLDVDGTLTIRGVSKDLRVPASLVYYPEDQDVRGPGDWVMLSTSFRIKLTDFQVPLSPKTLGPKVANDVTIAIDAMARSGETKAAK